jgi:hypothetical protein
LSRPLGAAREIGCEKAKGLSGRVLCAIYWPEAKAPLGTAVSGPEMYAAVGWRDKAMPKELFLRAREREKESECVREREICGKMRANIKLPGLAEERESGNFCCVSQSVSE